MPITAYVTPQALVDEFGEKELTELTDLADPPAYQVDYAVAQRSCDRVNAEIGAVLAARYRMPLATVPEVLRYVALDLGHFYLYSTEPPDWVKTRFDQARARLRDIQTGALPLGQDAAGTDVAQTTTDMPEMVSGDKAFARSNGW